jgi:hypothetical protein
MRKRVGKRAGQKCRTAVCFEQHVTDNRGESPVPDVFLDGYHEPGIR